MKLIPLEEVEKMILNANIGGLARASLFAEKTNLPTIDPIATIDEMIEEYQQNPKPEHWNGFLTEGYFLNFIEELKSRLSLTQK